MTLQPPRRSPDNEQKLIVLACLDRVGPCTEWQLLQLLTEHDVMNYFDMMISLSDLCSRGQAARSQKANGHLYELTDAGKEALELFGSRVPGSVRTLLKTTGDKWRLRFRQEAQYRREITRTERGDYLLTLTASEQDTETLEVRLPLPTRELAARMADNWPRYAEEIYGVMIRLLSEEQK